jgi:hypothetical protein
MCAGIDRSTGVRTNPPIAGHRRPDQRGQHPGRRDRREDLRTQVRRVLLADDHVERGQQQPAAQSLHDPPGDEHGHGRREPGDQQTGQEQRHPEDDRQPRPTTVAQHPRQHQADDVGHDEAGERPAVERDAVQFPRRGRQRGRDGHGLERDQGDDDEQAGADQA